MPGLRHAAAALLAAALMCGCGDSVTDRVPNAPVSINLGDIGMWNTWGVNGFGIFRYFIHSGGISEPAGFFYNQTSYTGFGGVLLIGGMDPFTGNTNVPLAYDLACPVERDPNVRVQIDLESLEAVCPQCGSRYDVVMAAGAPCGGEALNGTRRYGLRRFRCVPTMTGGYVINN